MPRELDFRSGRWKTKISTVNWRYVCVARTSYPLRDTTVSFPLGNTDLSYRSDFIALRLQSFLLLFLLPFFPSFLLLFLPFSFVVLSSRTFSSAFLCFKTQDPLFFLGSQPRELLVVTTEQTNTEPKSHSHSTKFVSLPTISLASSPPTTRQRRERGGLREKREAENQMDRQRPDSRRAK